MNTKCTHHYVPGPEPKGLEPWEAGVRVAVCEKCGLEHSNQQFMPPGVWALRETLRISGRVALEEQLHRETKPASIFGTHFSRALL